MPTSRRESCQGCNFYGNSQRARDKAINLMNEEGKEVTVEFLMNHLAVEDGNTQHKFLSQINSSSSVTFAAYDRRQTEGRATNQNSQMEEMGHRINQECRLLHLPPRQPWGSIPGEFLLKWGEWYWWGRKLLVWKCLAHFHGREPPL